MYPLNFTVSCGHEWPILKAWVKIPSFQTEHIHFPYKICFILFLNATDHPLQTLGLHWFPANNVALGCSDLNNWGNGNGIRVVTGILESWTKIRSSRDTVS